MSMEETTTTVLDPLNPLLVNERYFIVRNKVHKATWGDTMGNPLSPLLSGVTKRKPTL